MQPIEFLNIHHAKSAQYVSQLHMTTHPLYDAAQRLLYASDYACRQFTTLQALLQEDDGTTPLLKTDYLQKIAAISLDLSSAQFAKALRVFRHYHLLRLVLREYGALATTSDTLTAWSDCADAMLLHAKAYCERQLMLRFGKPRDASGCEVDLFLLAMGKLGGRELNISSDVDLILSYSAAGDTDGEQSISNQQYFTQFAQQFIQILQTVTPEGFVFRVDLRLRPNGDSGALVCSLAAMEVYYQEQGRDWERYAMAKARVITVDFVENNALNQLIKPFVYRRYVDFSVIASLRSMKAMIAREVALKPLLDDLKRGWGGIREIEFVIQCMQLIRGGRQPSIQQQNALLALQSLERAGLLQQTEALQTAYLFLRQLENALQIHNDQQQHHLPSDPVIQAQILVAMAQSDWDSLQQCLQVQRQVVKRFFDAILSHQDTYEDNTSLISHQLMSLWQGHLEPEMAIHLLASLQFSAPESCYQMLHDFRHSSRCRRLNQSARIRLDQFMVLLLRELGSVTETQSVLLSVLNLLERIVNRSVYLALLIENPRVLRELLYWFAQSTFITSLIVHHPFLLEVLIDDGMSTENQVRWQPFSRRKLAQVLHEQLERGTDREQRNEMMRQFKLTCWLLAARSELNGYCDAGRIGRYLADVAEVIIAAVVEQSFNELEEITPEIRLLQSQFTVIAYGKLGSQEMNYDSDVDLVFLHSAKEAHVRLVTRLTQKILHSLTLRLQSGVLYTVDTRLRPSGESGLLVSHMDAFIDYQTHQAWTWEHQALLKARVIVAKAHAKAKFTQLRRQVLLLPRVVDKLRQEVLVMREKIDKHQPYIALKHAAGGLLDLEFLIQYLLLAYPTMQGIRHTNPRKQLEALLAAGMLSSASCQLLQQAYDQYHHWLHQSVLQPQASAVCIEAFSEQSALIHRLFHATPNQAL